MRTIDLILKKKQGLELTKEEINFFINSVMDKSMPDYQISAFLMAVCFQGMSDLETSYLTEAIVKSGSFVEQSKLPKGVLDKHSTGGVGDKITLTLTPLLAASGIPCLKLSGRALGHTGGTIDKLESIPGFNTERKIEDMIEQVKKINLAIGAQTKGLTPADGILYALRDVTGTVDNVSLIASSVISKKIASGAENIVLDVKCGKGAFMKDPQDAVHLAKLMVQIGKHLGRKVIAVITSMDEPLGRAVGNSFVPLCFLSVSVVLNIGLDLLFILGFGWGVEGAASATVISQAFSAIGLFAYAGIKYPELSLDFRALRWDRGQLRDILTFSSLTCLQQSVMNFGILLVQGVVNKFGVVVMAAFAAAVKIDSFAYMPVQDFGNAFSTFVAQNYGAGKKDRIIKGVRGAVACVMAFSLIVSVLVMAFSRYLMLMFVDASEEEVIEEGIRYLWIEGPFYFMIGILFLLYGYYRAVGKPGMSTVLTVFSLGTRVGLSYALSPVAGVQGIWWSIPIGWFLADAAGIAYYYFCRKKI